MGTRWFIISPALALLCGACAVPLDGVWLFYMDAEANVDLSCQESISHNFSDALVPEAEGEDEVWTSSDATAQNESLFFGLFTTSGSETATLIIGGVAYPGLFDAESVWTFSWTDFNQVSSLDEHDQGYGFSVVADETREEVIELIFEEDAVAGSFSIRTSETHQWQESDSWFAKDLADVLGNSGQTGQIPSSQYLITEEPGKFKAIEVPAYNTNEASDCDDEDCAIQKLETCCVEYSVTGERTALTADEFEGVDGAGQVSGY